MTCLSLPALALLARGVFAPEMSEKSGRQTEREGTRLVFDTDLTLISSRSRVLKRHGGVS